ncbi:HrpE/YscL family type III secretion apparatus protein [Ralstonia pickettii]|uniref:Type 3 secretion system stator protein n=2 Tax=Ralstonia TaxID=48736 RepID=A0A2N4TSJ2_RALPI|nr:MULTISPECIES: type III secretion system stator protein SctL [Ralstonia]PLC42674.1 HrpE/YscL family type III secretion apparatus protein [Ralstonia pickettii]CAJ0692890.1 Yop proteins translocation protein L [Ralstonia wenshanensis]
MVIWLRRDAALGVGSDVIRAEDYRHVVDLDAAWQAVQAARDAAVADAHAQAEAIVAEARATADEILRQADQRAQRSAKLGYAAGQRRALEDFHASMATRAHDDAEATRREEDRLATTVMQAVEQVVLETDRQALFARVAATLGRVLQSQSRLTVRVCADEIDAARAAFAKAVQTGTLNAAFEVLADDRAEPGHCQCEWDHGVADASLRVQLAALRQALSGKRRVAAEPSVAYVDDEDAFDEDTV